MSTDPISLALEIALQEVAEWVSDILVRAFNQLKNALTPLIGSFNRFIIEIGRGLGSVIDQLKEELTGLGDVIAQSLRSAIESIADVVADITRAVVEEVKGLVAGIADEMKQLIRETVEGFTGLIDKGIQLVNDVTVEVLATLRKLAGDVFNWLSDLFGEIKTGFQSIVNDVTQFLTDAWEVVKAAISVTLEVGRDVVTAIYDGIKDFISTVINAIGVGLRELYETIAELPETIANMAESLGEGLDEFIKEPIEAIAASMWETLKSMIGDEAEKDLPRLESAVHNAITGQGIRIKQRADFEQTMKEFLPQSPTARFLLNMFLGVITIIQMGSGIAQTDAKVLLQEHAKEFPYEILSPPDSVRAVHYGRLDTTVAIENIRRNGFTSPDAQRMLEISETPPPEGEVIAWLLRDLIGDDQADKILKQHGYSPSSISNFKAAAKLIPQAQDLITMAVREVFSPDVARRFGQFDDFPQEFADWGAKIGLTEEWAQRYWAAHWALPSIQMGFEMLHRRVIQESDMDLLLRAGDVMPFWRDKIKAISYSPLTRVDVRRMHKTGVLTEQEVKESYLDLGYNDTNAERMTRFTVEYNRDAPDEDVDELGNLTRGAVLGYYKDGIFTRDETFGMLIEIGLSGDAAGLYISSIDMELQRDERRDQIDIVLQKALAGILTDDEAQDELAKLELTTIEIDRALIQLTKAKAKATKLPSKSDLDKFLAAKLMDDTEYLENMAILGYSQKWARLYLDLNKSKARASV